MPNFYKIIRYIPLSALRLLAKVAASVIASRPHLKFYRNVASNLKLSYPQLNETQLNDLIQKSIINQCLSSVESAKSWAMPPQWSMQQIRQVHDVEILHKGLQHPNGMLIIVPHLGTWEMMNAWVAQQGALTIMYKPSRSPQLDAFILEGRQRLNATLVPTDASGVKAIFKTLKSGGFSVILPDHVPDVSGGVVVPFFNIPTLSSTLASKLASKTQCALVGLSCIRREDGDGFDMYCTDLSQEQLYSTDQNVATAALNQAVEQMVQRFPEHYMWSYRR
ncbi:MAG: lysophospholipid acyltransferase family protein, partial [Acinetobacter sp.]|nr:lysophospholipid acyltransferase family protein [Acinetobacter sp.]